MDLLSVSKRPLGGEVYMNPNNIDGVVLLKKEQRR